MGHFALLSFESPVFGDPLDLLRIKSFKCIERATVSIHIEKNSSPVFNQFLIYTFFNSLDRDPARSAPSKLSFQSLEIMADG
jgi:hypothetical protein